MSVLMTFLETAIAFFGIKYREFLIEEKILIPVGAFVVLFAIIAFLYVREILRVREFYGTLSELTQLYKQENERQEALAENEQILEIDEETQEKIVDLIKDAMKKQEEKMAAKSRGNNV